MTKGWDGWGRTSEPQRKKCETGDRPTRDHNPLSSVTERSETCDFVTTRLLPARPPGSSPQLDLFPYSYTPVSWDLRVASEITSFSLLYSKPSKED